MMEYCEEIVLPADLLRRLAARQCVAYIGAGFSAPAGMPGWAQLLNRLIEAAAGNGRVPEDRVVALRAGVTAGEYQPVASAIRQYLHESEILEIVDECFGDHRLHDIDSNKIKSIEQRMENIVNIPWRGIITTNYDNIIEIALTKYTNQRNKKLFEASKRLGMILNTNLANELFFTKIHGSLGLSRIVLNTEEYDEIYLKNAVTSRFLTSIMMSYNLVFIGCSLEDHILQARRELTAEFDGHIPIAYALMQANERNKRRSEWLRNSARIESIFYGDVRHEGVDKALSLARQHCAKLLEEPLRIEGVSKYLRKINIDQRWNEIGEINRQLVLAIAAHSGYLRHIDILEPSDLENWPSLLKTLTGTERIYRTMFLVASGFLSEDNGHAGTAYLLTAAVQDLLSELAKVSVSS